MKKDEKKKKRKKHSFGVLYPNWINLVPIYCGNLIYFEKVLIIVFLAYFWVSFWVKNNKIHINQAFGGGGGEGKMRCKYPLKLYQNIFLALFS